MSYLQKIHPKITTGLGWWTCLIFFTPAPLHNINTNLENRVLSADKKIRRSAQSPHLGLGSPCQQWSCQGRRFFKKNLVDLHVSKQEHQLVLISFFQKFTKFILLLFPSTFETEFSQNVCRGYSVGCYIYICIHLGFFDLAHLSGYLPTMGEEKGIEE